MRLIIDLDNTLTRDEDCPYPDKPVNTEVAEAVRRYKALGFTIAIHTSRNMKTHGGNVGKINASTLPVILEWLKKHDIPFDEIHTGKPWCGENGFYVDDRAVRPDEFASLNYEEIRALLKMDT